MDVLEQARRRACICNRDCMISALRVVVNASYVVSTFLFLVPLIPTGHLVLWHGLSGRVGSHTCQSFHSHVSHFLDVYSPNYNGFLIISN